MKVFRSKQTPTLRLLRMNLPMAHTTTLSSRISSSSNNHKVKNSNKINSRSYNTSSSNTNNTSPNSSRSRSINSNHSSTSSLNHNSSNITNRARICTTSKQGHRPVQWIKTVSRGCQDMSLRPLLDHQCHHQCLLGAST